MTRERRLPDESEASRSKTNQSTHLDLAKPTIHLLVELFEILWCVGHDSVRELRLENRDSQRLCGVAYPFALIRAHDVVHLPVPDRVRKLLIVDLAVRIQVDALAEELDDRHWYIEVEQVCGGEGVCVWGGGGGGGGVWVGGGGEVKGM